MISRALPGPRFLPSASVAKKYTLLFLSTYLAYTYFEGNRASGKPAVKISDISERVSFEDLGPYFAGHKGAFVLFDKNKNEYGSMTKRRANSACRPVPRLR